MLYLMGSSAHYSSGDIGSNSVGLIIGLVIVAAIEANALFGKQGPMTTVRGFITCGLALTVVLVGLLTFL
jgi:F0F1-type ATP synthase membrane subunit c/vacuolar-type H+-ATPase subunit K